MKLSVIIPTHNRADILKTCLARVFEQKGADFEVIVVDDGSTDNTEEVARQFDCKYLKQPASHQGVARNRGAKEAIGDLIVFIGDDIFMEPEFLSTHAQAHKKNPDENAVVLGFSTWDPALEINDYMRFLESSGWQFGYGFLRPGAITHPEPYKFFYTSNLSVKSSFFQKEQFNENFRHYGWEDIELGYRLWKNQGMKMIYEPGAKGLHHHAVTDADLPKRMRQIGESAKHFQKLHPSARVVPRGMKAVLIRIAVLPFLLPLGRLLGKDFYYKLLCWREFLIAFGPFFR